MYVSTSECSQKVKSAKAKCEANALKNCAILFRGCLHNIFNLTLLHRSSDKFYIWPVCPSFSLSMKHKDSLPIGHWKKIYLKSGPDRDGKSA